MCSEVHVNHHVTVNVLFEREFSICAIKKKLFSHLAIFTKKKTYAEGER